jgi:hypothetical protein
MRSLTVCRRANIERHASVRGRAFWCGGVARSASRRLSCGFARVKRPNLYRDFPASTTRDLMALMLARAMMKTARLLHSRSSALITAVRLVWVYKHRSDRLSHSPLAQS